MVIGRILVVSDVAWDLESRVQYPPLANFFRENQSFQSLIGVVSLIKREDKNST